MATSENEDSDFEEDVKSEQENDPDQDEEVNGDDHQEENEDENKKNGTGKPSNNFCIKRKIRVPGVMYLSTLPPNMTALHLRQIFEKYGEVGRIFLQPDERKFKSRKKKQKFTYNSGTYTEGWVEMADKKLARRLAETLNSTQIVEGKKKKFSEHMWNIKYLSKFRWTHLTERLAYERAIFQQKMRTESAQARRETEAFMENVAASKKYASIAERKLKKGTELTENRKLLKFKQRKTVNEIQEAKKRKVDEKPPNKEEILSKIFGS